MMLFQATTSMQPFAGVKLKLSNNYDFSMRVYGIHTLTFKGTDNSLKTDFTGTIISNNAKFSSTFETEFGKTNTAKVKLTAEQTFKLIGETLKLNTVALQQLQATYGPKSPNYQIRLAGGLQLASSKFTATITLTKPFNLNAKQPDNFFSNAETTLNVKVPLADIYIEGQAKFVNPFGSTRYTEYRLGVTVPLDVGK